MAKKTQGSDLFALLPVLDSSGEPTAVREVVKIGCITNFNGGDNTADQIDISCLSGRSRRFLKGLRSAGQATFNINADPTDASHIRLHTAFESDDEAYDEISFTLGWSDGSAAPTAAQNSDGDYEFNYPSTRTWYTINGYVANFPFDFQQNTVVQTNVSIQKSGRGYWVPKGA